MYIYIYICAQECVCVCVRVTNTWYAMVFNARVSSNPKIEKDTRVLLCLSLPPKV